METETANAKAGLRKRICAVLRGLSEGKREMDSAKLRAKLGEQSFYRGAASILFFASLPAEVDLWPLLENALAAGKIVALPRFDQDRQRYAPHRVGHPRAELAPGRFGIREPAANCAEIPLEDLDLVLVPGVAFDLNGRRLGRGKGFYDRLLADCPAWRIGLAFDEQIVDQVPAEERDVKMDWILTPERCVKPAGDR
ncbi:MAG: 5-formyltetrahydrofolate cyclo-ligase [Verrucomicrobiota bacterium]|nr:5-formyltetrahydrofolate cyclo-ligase [Verrucomicrobiota bacterium]